MTNERRWTAEEYGAMAGFSGDFRDSWWNQDFLELMAARWRLAAVRRVLDVDCGHGHWGQRLATLLPVDAEIVGVDHEPAFLARALARSARAPQRFEYVEGSASALPFDEGAFDLVTCQTVLIHVPDAAAALAEMARVTRPGGARGRRRAQQPGRARRAGVGRSPAPARRRAGAPPLRRALSGR